MRAQAGAEARAGEWDRAARLLRDVLGLWTGDPLADVRPGFQQRAEASRLAELRLDVLEECAEADLRLGRNEACAADLRALAAGHPFRERFWELLMLALYRAGRQGDALSAYQQARGALRDGLGLDPGRRLQDLHARILAADPALSGDPAPAAGRCCPRARLAEQWRRTARRRGSFRPCCRTSRGGATRPAGWAIPSPGQAASP